jgi:drug/metabolite transporter (DMT)-like permease
MTKDTRDHVTAVLAFMVFVLLLGLLFVEIPDGNKEILYLLAGAIIGAFGTAVSYWLGSSDGSAQKTAMMSKDKV